MNTKTFSQNVVSSASEFSTNLVEEKKSVSVKRKKLKQGRKMFREANIEDYFEFKINKHQEFCANGAEKVNRNNVQIDLVGSKKKETLEAAGLRENIKPIKKIDDTIPKQKVESFNKYSVLSLEEKGEFNEEIKQDEPPDGLFFKLNIKKKKKKKKKTTRKKLTLSKTSFSTILYTESKQNLTTNLVRCSKCFINHFPLKKFCRWNSKDRVTRVQTPAHKNEVSSIPLSYLECKKSKSLECLTQFRKCFDGTAQMFRGGANKNPQKEPLMIKKAIESAKKTWN